MSDKLKSMDYQLMVNRVQELMTKGKESKRAGWAMSEIVEKIGTEFGQDYEESCRQYIKNMFCIAGKEIAWRQRMTTSYRQKFFGKEK